MITRSFVASIVAFFMVAAVLTIARAADVRYLSGRVVDNAEILSPATRSALMEALKAHETRTTNQIAVLTVQTLGDDSVEGFATKVFESWKLGQKGKDNGVLMIIAVKDHRMRIEVGYGLEGTLTDVAGQPHHPQPDDTGVQGERLRPRSNRRGRRDRRHARRQGADDQ